MPSLRDLTLSLALAAAVGCARTTPSDDPPLRDEPGFGQRPSELGAAGGDAGGAAGGRAPSVPTPPVVNPPPEQPSRSCPRHAPVAGSACEVEQQFCQWLNEGPCSTSNPTQLRQCENGRWTAPAPAIACNPPIDVDASSSASESTPDDDAGA